MNQESPPTQLIPTVTQPPSVVPPPPKTNWWKVSTIVLVLILMGGSSYLAFGNTLGSTPNPTPPTTQSTPISSSAPDPTADWKMYSSELGYSFKYPSDWDLKNFGELATNVIEYVGIHPEKIQNEFTAIGVTIFKDTYEQLLEKRSHYTPIEEKSIVVDGTSGIREIGTDPDNNTFVKVMLPFGKNVISIRADKKYELIFDQILSTFQFIDDDISEEASPGEKVNYQAIADWQTLADPVAKFSIQYPPTYKNDTYMDGTGGDILSCNTDPQRGEICLSGYSVHIYNTYTGGSRRDWFYKQMPSVKGSLINPSFTDLVVGGTNALVVMDTNTGGSTGSWVIMPKGSQVILLSFPFGGADPSGLNSIKQFLSTFKYL